MGDVHVSEQPDYHLNNDRSVAVGDFHFMPMDTCPINVKVLLETPDGVAVLAAWNGKEPFNGWFPIPKKRQKGTSHAPNHRPDAV